MSALQPPPALAMHRDCVPRLPHRRGISCEFQMYDRLRLMPSSGKQLPMTTAAREISRGSSPVGGTSEVGGPLVEPVPGTSGPEQADSHASPASPTVARRRPTMARRLLAGRPANKRPCPHAPLALLAGAPIADGIEARARHVEARIRGKCQRRDHTSDTGTDASVGGTGDHGDADCTTFPDGSANFECRAVRNGARRQVRAVLQDGCIGVSRQIGNAACCRQIHFVARSREHGFAAGNGGRRGQCSAGGQRGDVVACAA